MPFDQALTSAVGDRRVVALNVEQECLRLRKKGWTTSRIAEAVGRSERSIRRSLNNALADDIFPDVVQLRALENARLDELLGAIWQRALEGDNRSVDRVLRIMERRAKLFGLDATERRDGDPKDSSEKVLDVRVWDAVTDDASDAGNEPLPAPGAGLDGEDEDHRPGGGDGGGEDVLCAEVGVQEADGEA
jgi:Homeodomain-like domain-containing protein